MLDSVYFLIAVSFAIGLVAFLLFLWGTLSRQFHDTEEPKYRIMHDEEKDEEKGSKTNFP